MALMLDQNSDLQRLTNLMLADAAPDTGPPSFAHALESALRPARLRVTHDPRQLEAWALALTSRGLSPMLHWFDGAFELHVPHNQLAVATAELDALDDEERDSQRARLADAALEQPVVSKHAAAGALLVALMLLVFFAVTGPRAGGADWFAAGSSDAERVLHGEWWRAVTALTLHSDGGHVLSNVGIGTLVVGAVMRSEGVGWGAALVLAAGTAGNLVNAWAHQSLHSSVGFSTALFGAIGILGGVAYVQARRRVRPLRPAWTALAGTLALLALLGTSEKSNVDMLAHLFGALAGLSLGLLVATARWRPTTRAGQWSSGLGAAAAVLGAWLVALA
jgi:rhomboid protease GluP